MVEKEGSEGRQYRHASNTEGSAQRRTGITCQGLRESLQGA